MYCDDGVHKWDGTAYTTRACTNVPGSRGAISHVRGVKLTRTLAMRTPRATVFAEGSYERASWFGVLVRGGSESQTTETDAPLFQALKATEINGLSSAPGRVNSRLERET